MSGRYGPLKISPLPSVVIGSQTWMLYNLDVTTYRNGDTIEQVTDSATWASLTTGAWCYYNNNSANGAVYGKLYNWYAVNDPRGLAPVGYHIPSNTEWGTLINYLGGASIAGGALKEAGTTHWGNSNTGATNSSGWTGLPGGTRGGNNGLFSQFGEFGFYQSSTETNSENSIWYYLYSSTSDILEINSTKRNGFSVRCLKD